MLHINGKITGGDVILKSLTVTDNGKYTAPSGQAWNVVNVNVEGGGGGTVELATATIFNNIFRQAKGIKKLIAPKGSSIRANSFMDNDEIEEIIIGGNTSNINTIVDGSVFVNCSSLKKIDFATTENNVMSFGEKLISGCTNLEELIIRSDILPTLYGVLYEDSDLPKLKIYVQPDLVDEYKQANNWILYADKIYPISE